MASARSTKVEIRNYVVRGALIGLVLGIAEPMIAAVGDADYWFRVSIYFWQFGFCGWVIGAVIGYIVAKRVERRNVDRARRGLCIACGYDLTGNTSGTCPECGRGVVGQARNCPRSKV